MHANNITHFAVRAENVGRAKKFYETVFGWQFQEWGPPDFYLIEAKILQAGGTILMKPMEIPTVGRLIQFADPEGNHVCAMQYERSVHQ
jgi:uncharacterized protein